VAVREVLRMPHPALKRRCAEIADPEEIERVARDLIDTMEAAPRCVGVAAPQIGDEVRMCVVDVTGHPKAKSCAGRVVLVNPVVVSTSEGSKVGREGCLSVPDFTADVRRAARVVVEATDAAGAPVRVEADAFEARCLLHEIDHLDGILFLDRVESASAVFRRRDYG
jgi:peptide deformylase